MGGGRLAMALIVAGLLAACEAAPSGTEAASEAPPVIASPAPAEAASPTPAATATPLATSGATPTATAAPTPTPEPTPVPNSLDEPAQQATASVEFVVEPQVPPEGSGLVVVRITNPTAEPIDEIVLRWPTALRDQLWLAPFFRSPDRLVPPLTLPWTKWVEGPGTEGEPEGTTSLGWGPLDPGITLEIVLAAERRIAEPIAFDFQLLDENAILRRADGSVAETRVEVP